MSNPTVVQGGQVFADLIRVTPLDALGHPVVGTGKGYQTDNVTQMDYNPELQAGPDLTMVGGKGVPCASYRGRDTLKRLNVMLALCLIDPVLDKLLVGGVAYNDGGTPGSIIGYQDPRALTAYPACAIELWQQLIQGDAIIGYEHHLFPKVELTIGNRSAQAQFADRQMNGFAYENPNWGDPYGDFGQDTHAIHQYVFSATEPAAVGYIDVTSGAPAATGPRTVTTTTTAAPGDVLLADATGGAFTVNLPPAAGRGTIIVKRINTGANAVTIDASGSEQIDGALTLALTVAEQSATLVSNGTAWFVI
jgi:hypothetical protein